MYVSLINNSIPVFLTIIHKNRGEKNNLEIESLGHKVIASYKTTFGSLRTDFRNCEKITESILKQVAEKSQATTASINRLDFILNELIENVFKYSNNEKDEELEIVIHEVFLKQKLYETYVISIENESTSKNVKGIVQSFKLISKYYRNNNDLFTDKAFRKKKGHLGWVAITKFNAMVHVVAQKRNNENYNISTRVLLTNRKS